MQLLTTTYNTAKNFIVNGNNAALFSHKYILGGTTLLGLFATCSYRGHCSVAREKKNLEKKLLLKQKLTNQQILGKNGRLNQEVTDEIFYKTSLILNPKSKNAMNKLEKLEEIQNKESNAVQEIIGELKNNIKREKLYQKNSPAHTLCTTLNRIKIAKPINTPVLVKGFLTDAMAAPSPHKVQFTLIQAPPSVTQTNLEKTHKNILNNLNEIKIHLHEHRVQAVPEAKNKNIQNARQGVLNTKSSLTNACKNYNNKLLPDVLNKNILNIKTALNEHINAIKNYNNCIPFLSLLNSIQTEELESNIEKLDNALTESSPLIKFQEQCMTANKQLEDVKKNKPQGLSDAEWAPIKNIPALTPPTNWTELLNFANDLSKKIDDLKNKQNEVQEFVNQRPGIAHIVNYKEEDGNKLYKKLQTLENLKGEKEILKVSPEDKEKLKQSINDLNLLTTLSTEPSIKLKERRKIWHPLALGLIAFSLGTVVQYSRQLNQIAQYVWSHKPS